MFVRGSWIENSATQAVCSALTEQGFQALFVGGCVRNAILDAPVADIDIATDATPDDVMRCAKIAQLKSIPTGIDHGTITVISGGIAHEITTFRNDIETDGRHAIVRFSKDIGHDAARRDFTMNAIYARPDGEVLDPLRGLPDLGARLVRFIGDPNARICEDYLRSLRFFRFTAWYGDPALGIDQDGLAAITGNLEGLKGLSKERVGAELKKLLTAKDPAMAVAGMRSAGVLGAILVGADDRALAVLVHHEQIFGIAPDPIRRLSVLADVESAARLRLSKADVTRWSIMRNEVGSLKPAKHLGYLHGAVLARDILLLRAALLEGQIGEPHFKAAEAGADAVFPIKAKHLQGLSGRALGERLKELETSWIMSDFSLTREELLG